MPLFFQFNQSLDSRAEIHKKVILKLTDLYIKQFLTTVVSNYIILFQTFI